MAAAAALAVGCTSLTVQHNVDGPVPVQLRVDDAAYWLEEWQRAVQLPIEQYQQTLAARERDFETRPGPRSRIRLALLLAAGKPSARKPGRALELLKGVDRAVASKSAVALADLLQEVLVKQKAAKKPEKKPEKKSATACDVDLKKELLAAKARIRELEQQLHELTSIEQNIQERIKK